MSKHQQILTYLEGLPIGKRISVRSVANHLQVSDGTAYRAIKEAENRGIVETRPRSGTVRVPVRRSAIDSLTYQEIVSVTGSEVLAGSVGLNREFNKFSIGAMTRINIPRYLVDSGLVIVGDRTNIQKLALEHENAVLVTGGFDVEDSVIQLANEKGIPVLRSHHDTFTVASIINRALSNLQIKTDILTVEQVYRSSQDYGYLLEDQTVGDYLNLVKKNRFSRFPIVNQQQALVGVVTMRDAGNIDQETPLKEIMSRAVCTTELKTSLASISQRMIAEDFEMIPVVRPNQTLLGVLTRRDVMNEISKEKVSGMPTYSEQVSHRLVAEEDFHTLMVEPMMLDASGVLSMGILTELMTSIARRAMDVRGRNMIVQQLSVYFLQGVQVDEVLRIEHQVIQQTRRSALMDFQIYMGQTQVTKATVTIKMN